MFFVGNQFLKVCICSCKDRGVDTTWGTYNVGGSLRSNWACVKATTIGWNSNHIKFIIKLATIICFRVTTTGASSAHSRFKITTTTCDNKVAVTRTKCNPSINNYTVGNISIRRTTTDVVYNRKSNIASI
jgi:hypothetical protein